jgi:phosphate transport system regulatory protein PhoU
MASMIQKDISDVKNRILRMSMLVEEAVKTVFLSCQRHDMNLARRVIENDWEIDEIENDIGRLVLKTLALRQPMAGDLRFLTSSMMIAEQLERVGDHAANIAEQVLFLSQNLSSAYETDDIEEIANTAVEMLADSINSFVYGDADMAHRVLQKDSEVDEMYTRLVNKEISDMEQGSSPVKSGVSRVIQALNIERIADLATNIAEDVIFLEEGRIVRHENKPGKDSRKAGQQTGHQESADVPSDTTDASQACPGTPQNREPLECLENHAKVVHESLVNTAEAVRAFTYGNMELFVENSEKVSELESKADLIKRNVRAHLPRGIIMPIDKFELFAYLNKQDSIAGRAEDILQWLTYHDTAFHPDVIKGLEELLEQCTAITAMLPSLILSARSYFQTGDENIRVHVKSMIRKIREMENSADDMEHRLKKFIFSMGQDSLTIYYLIELIDLIGRTADNSESAADIMRSMIAR